MPGRCFGDFFKFGEESRSETIVKAERSISRHARGIMHSALAKEFALPLLGEIACVLAGFAAFGEWLDSTGYEASQDDLLIFRWSGGSVGEILLVSSEPDLLGSLIRFLGGLGVDAVTAEAFENEAVRTNTLALY